MAGFVVLGLKQRKKNRHLRYLHEQYTAYEYSVKSDDSGSLNTRERNETGGGIAEVSVWAAFCALGGVGRGRIT
jgi:hypothetical protein